MSRELTFAEHESAKQLKRYSVRLEFDIESIDLAEISIEATSKKEAIKLAIKAYSEGLLDLDYYSSDCMDTTLRTEYSSDWIVEEIDNGH